MIFVLLIIYQIKHFLADYPLQGRYMLGKFKPYPHFILPLLSHGLVHGVFTFLIALYFKSWDTSLALAFLDMAIHSGVDYLKANPEIGGRFSALSKKEAVKLIMEGITPNSIGPASQEEITATWKSNTYFWWALGADQFAHHLTHYLLIWMMLS